ncbi:MAG: antiviral reverse transcriptase Drt3a [Bacteroidales bacterium]|jgi:hypothetical protein|nr:antiviral reverse transcriptase Drt3a [Bacteroidales bacterium]
MNQSFSSLHTIKHCRKSEFDDFEILQEELSSELENVYNEIIEEKFEFDLLKTSKFYLTKKLTDILILRKLNDNIKRLYKEEQSNRRLIITQVKNLLEETCPFWVIKTDIKSFYESIERNRIVEKLQNDSMLSYHSVLLLNKVFDNKELIGSTGVPRGMNISSTLSEIYMRKFDKWISRSKSVYYFARFVDDIIIFSNSLNDALELIKNLNPKLNELAEGLTINKSKTELFDGNTLKRLNVNNGKYIGCVKNLEYLGYKFTKTKIDKSTYELKISIASKKVKKIKTRIVLALLDFSKNKDFELLEKRIKFLTGNYSIKKSFKGDDLRAGIYYNYMQVNDLSVFDELNNFYRKALFSKSDKFGNKINLTKNQKVALTKYCFKTGFQLKIYNPFTSLTMKQVIRCW